MAVPTSERIVQLSEWQTSLIPGVSLTAGDQRLRRDLDGGDEGRLIVDELRTGVRVTARSWVGVVRFEQFEVRISPKLAGDNLGLVEMIEFATGLDALRRNTSVRTLSADGCGLFDLVSLLLAEACEAVLRGGLLSDYVEREDELKVVRGRILYDRQVLKRFGQVAPLACRFDDHEQDITENRLLAAALEACSRRVTRDDVRRRVRRLSTILREVCRPDRLDLVEARCLEYHRMNEHYRNAHTLAWLLLDRLGPQDLLTQGRARCFSFLLDMNRLFEQFVTRLITNLLDGTAARVWSQRADQSIIVNASTNQPYARVVPDVLIETIGYGRVARLAVDAKYKLYDERKLSSGDVYQSFLYAYAYGGGVEGALPGALIVYPASSQSSRSVRLRVRSAQEVAGAEITAIALRIPDLLAEMAAGTQGPATCALVEAIRLGLGVQTASVT